jgi:16S rRNA (uracil1498-N3)-methyltransferase
VSNPVFLCPDLSGDRVVLDGPEGRHAATVRRTRVGEVLDLVDGLGTRCTGTVTATTKGTVTVEVTNRVVEPAPTPRITLVQALAKGDRGELAVELATEVGVDTIVPWAAARCIVSWSGERGTKALERWRSTAREAGKQSRRAWFPVVTEPVRTVDVAALPGQLLVLHEEAAVSLSTVELSGEVVLVVGPEGGLAPDELAALVAAGGRAVRLGPSVLRTSTAGAAAAAVVSSRVGRW